MAHSRLERIGTIYTRVTNLIRTGAMKLEDRPIWYDVYEAFPPADPPRFDRPAPNTEIRPIFYEEDNIRVLCHKRLGSSISSVNLSDNKYPTFCQEVIQRTQQIAKESKISVNEAFDQAFVSVRDEFVAARNKIPSPTASQPSSTTDVKPPQIKDIFET